MNSRVVSSNSLFHYCEQTTQSHLQTTYLISLKFLVYKNHSNLLLHQTILRLVTLLKSCTLNINHKSLPIIKTGDNTVPCTGIFLVLCGKKSKLRIQKHNVSNSDTMEHKHFKIGQWCWPWQSMLLYLNEHEITWRICKKYNW